MTYHDHDLHKASKTGDEFLRRFEGVEGKREFVDGRVVDMMTDVTAAHMRLTLALASVLLDRLGDDHAVAVADFGVETFAGIRFPDVMVSPNRYEGHELKAKDPSFIAEILSASSKPRDFGPKANEYTELPSLQHYLVLEQTEPVAWLWSRDEEGAFGEPLIFQSRSDVLALTAFDLEIALSDIYR